MNERENFVSIIRSEFADDRLTDEKGVSIFHPVSAEEAAKMFKLANRYRQKMYITGFGHNITPVGKSFINMMLVRTDRLSAIKEIAPQDFYITTGSGYPFREINQHLAETELFLPHASLRYGGSVGGAIATGLSAELNGQDLPLKKYFIKAEVVTPEGDIINPGSICFKSVSGYDIVKIFSSSWGLLGLIVSATFRVMPRSASAELNPMKMKPSDRENFLAGLAESSTGADAIYSRQIKAKFDPERILPIV
jgi:glycolate oxidase FAD binding subunit